MLSVTSPRSDHAGVWLVSQEIRETLGVFWEGRGLFLGTRFLAEELGHCIGYVALGFFGELREHGK